MKKFRRRYEYLKAIISTKKLKKTLRKSAKDRMRPLRRAQRTSSKMQARIDEVSEKLATLSEEPLLDSLAIINSFHLLQRRIRDGLNLPSELTFDTKLLSDTVQGALTVNLSRHILNTMTSLPSHDKREILDRIIEKNFPTAIEKGKKPRSVLDELQKLLSTPMAASGGSAFGIDGLTSSPIKSPKHEA